MYAKIFQKIFDSSIAEDWQLRVVFQDMLILSNRDGIVDMTHESIARRTNVPLGLVRECIKRLESPDPKSHTPEDEGRRLERLEPHRDWGWRIINFDRYRAIKNSEELRQQTKERVRRWREKQKKGNGAKGKGEVKCPEEVRQLIAYLNRKTGAEYRECKATVAMITARLGEKGVTFGGVRMMIDRQVILWKGDPTMEKYLRPTTLFNATKFNEYYAARNLEAKPPGSTIGKTNPRNVGTFESTTDYGKATPKLQRQTQAAKVAGQVDSNVPNPFSGG